MGISLTAFAPGGAVTAASVSTRLDTIEDFINGGIVAADYQVAPWVTPGEVRRAEIGSSFDATPLSRLETQDIAHLRKSNTWVDGFVAVDDVLQNQWIPVAGLNRTLHISPPRAESSCPVVVRFGFYAYEKEGGTATPGVEAARFEIVRDGLYFRSQTARRICCETTTKYDWARRYIQIEALIDDVPRGTHTFGVYEYVIDNGGAATRNSKFIWIKARTLIVRPVYR